MLKMTENRVDAKGKNLLNRIRFQSKVSYQLERAFLQNPKAYLFDLPHSGKLIDLFTLHSSKKQLLKM